MAPNLELFLCHFSASQLGGQLLLTLLCSPAESNVSFNSFASTMQRALLLYFSAACATADASMVYDVTLLIKLGS